MCLHRELLTCTNHLVKLQAVLGISLPATRSLLTCSALNQELEPRAVAVAYGRGRSKLTATSDGPRGASSWVRTRYFLAVWTTDIRTNRHSSCFDVVPSPRLAEAARGIRRVPLCLVRAENQAWSPQTAPKPKLRTRARASAEPISVDLVTSWWPELPELLEPAPFSVGTPLDARARVPRYRVVCGVSSTAS